MICIASIDWSMVGALASCVAVSVALFFHILNLRNTWRSNSAKMVMDFASDFDSADMRNHRSHFAKLLLNARDSIDLRKNTPVLEFLKKLPT
ncbi:MAG: hypothetical protein HY040_14720 [Planctomycetes bacterium]|nr:hypothetical protein [Planctomycetota bacterium]